VLKNSRDERKAVLSSYMDLIRKNHVITARRRKKIIVSFAEKTEIPKRKKKGA
jgi:hypothetical protein